MRLGDSGVWTKRDWSATALLSAQWQRAVWLLQVHSSSSILPGCSTQLPAVGKEMRSFTNARKVPHCQRRALYILHCALWAGPGSCERQQAGANKHKEPPAPCSIHQMKNPASDAPLRLVMESGPRSPVRTSNSRLAANPAKSRHSLTNARNYKKHHHGEPRSIFATSHCLISLTGLSAATHSLSSTHFGDSRLKTYDTTIHPDSSSCPSPPTSPAASASP